MWLAGKFLFTAKNICLDNHFWHTGWLQVPHFPRTPVERLKRDKSTDTRKRLIKKHCRFTAFHSNWTLDTQVFLFFGNAIFVLLAPNYKQQTIRYPPKVSWYIDSTELQKNPVPAGTFVEMIFQTSRWVGCVIVSWKLAPYRTVSFWNLRAPTLPKK